jgi:shikimate kinase
MIFYVLGFMGCGKTYWADRWGKAYDIPVHDMDAIIEEEEGMRCVEIFEKKGEAYFREKESRLLKQLTALGGDRIISCGGGTPIYKSNMDWMNENGMTIYLSAEPDYLLRNLLSGENKRNRALIKNIHENELLFFINKKLNERMPFYKKSKLVLNVETITVQDFENYLSHA